jgi:beta-glucosidase
VVVTLGAGPVIMPWLEDVPAVIHAWFPGEQFAPALADVLTGRTEPGGRLPITFPVDESATPIQDREQYPGVDGIATYSEGLLVGYRWYQQQRIKPAYPFGHGLGYTSFDFDDLQVEVTEAGIDVAFRVRNIGARHGKAVPQLYLTYPPGAGEPPAQLKGFDVVRLEPGEARNVKINVPLDDLAIFDERSGSRVVPPELYEIQLGASSAELLAKAERQIGSGRSQQADGAR